MTARGHSAKPVTRREVRDARREREASRPGGDGDALARHLPEALALLGRPGGADAPPATVAVYVSLPGEPATGALRRALRSGGHRVLLPFLLADLDLDWVVDRDGTAAPADPLRPPGPRLGLPALTSADLVLVPALAVDGAGTRLGQGGGSYDRALARLRGRPAGAGGPLVLAVVHEDEVLAGARLPREQHDVPVHGVLTPAGVRLLGAAAVPRPPAPPPRG